MTYDEYINETMALGFLQKGQKAYGEYEGLPLFCVFNGSSSAKVVTVTVTFNKNGGRGFIKELNKAVKRLGGASYSTLNADAVLLALKTKDGFTACFREAMDILKGLAYTYGLEAPGRCPLCGRGTCDGYALIKNVYMPAHRSCLEQVYRGTSERAQQNLREGSYLSGICGGLAGGIIATVPSILSIWFAQRIFAVLMLLIPLGASFGYTKCNGKRSRMAGPILIVVSLLSMYAMEYVFWLLSFVTSGYYTFGQALTTTLPFLLDPSFWVEMTKNAATELVFLALAIAMSWKELTKTAGSDASNVSASMDTYTERS